MTTLIPKALQRLGLYRADPTGQGQVGDERIRVIRDRHARATPGVWQVKSHSHPEAGCRCLSCYVTTGARLDHPSWKPCDETDAMQDAVRHAHGKPQEACYDAPIPYDDAVFAAHAQDDLAYLLSVIDELRRAGGL